jgi:hypothetical protein
MSPTSYQTAPPRGGLTTLPLDLPHDNLARFALVSQRIEVQRVIAAEAAEIFALLASPDGHVAIDASGMLMWAEGEPVTAVGDRFTVHMDRDALRDFDMGEYEVDVVISVFERDREIAWTIDGTLQPPIGHVYGYRLEPVEGGTSVTSYYDWSNLHEQYREIAESLFPVISEQNLTGTLGILARTVAPGRGRPGANLTERSARGSEP